MVETEPNSMIKVMQDELLPLVISYIRQKTYPFLIEDFSKLASYSSLTCGEIESIWLKISDSQLPTEIIEKLSTLCSCAFLMKASYDSDFTSKIAKKCFATLQTLKKQNFKIEEVSEDISNQFITCILSSQSFQELSEWIIFINQYSMNFSDCRLAKSALEFKFKALSWTQLSTTDFSSLIALLSEINKASPEHWDFQDLAHILTILALNLIENNLSSTDQFINSQISKCLRYLQSFDYLDEPLKAEINEFIQIKGTGSSTSTAINLTENGENESQGKFSDEEIKTFGIIDKWGEKLVIQETDWIYFLRKGDNNSIAVLKANLRLDNGESKIVAVKYYKSTERKWLLNYHTEIEILKKLSDTRHKAFLQLYGSFMDTVVENEREYHRLNIIMDYCQKTLMNDIDMRKKEGRNYTQIELWDAIKQLIEGFAVLSNMKIYHQDIKPHNILISDDVYKISDFNVSKTTNGITTITKEATIQGTSGYFSPELQKAFNDYKSKNGPSRVKFNPGKSDVFSLGLTILQMASLKSVIDLNLPENQSDLINKIENLPYDGKVKDILRRMMILDYHQRPSFIQLVSLVTEENTVRCE
ncbi:unnamed protein product [Blepharisma stoltei]|uniref:non-specific serine/threonine protein kinase n=1 Tax=Blepharisma stoltei TaxID=1481888 RepID=A0AAU9J448_9CILI|nr:unnamed protein product [Blepharisma stoltei]